MGEIINLMLLILLTAVTVVALLALLPALIPARVRQTQQILQTTPGRAFLIGLVNFLFFFIVAAVLAQGGDGGGLLALIILLALAAFAFVGLAGLLLTLRARIYGQNGDGLALTVKTAVLLVLATLVPMLGWLVLAPILLIAGLGAAIMTLARRKRPTPGYMEEDTNTERV